MLTSADGIKNGEILLGPLVWQTTELFSIAGNPPIPDALLTPNLSRSMLSSMPASFIASLVACSPSWINLSAFFTSFGFKTVDGSKSFTSEAICAEKPSGSNIVMVSIPHSPATIASNAVSLSCPTPFIMPRPVTTTLFIVTPYISWV